MSRRIYSNYTIKKTFIISLNNYINHVSNFKKLKTFEPLSSSLTIKRSHIHGLGLFATCEIPQHNELGISHVKDDRFSHGYIRTPLGGFLIIQKIQTVKLFMMKILLKLKLYQI